ncbi:HAD family hydrolase [Succiniclasticum ruminis]|uniref:Phosphoglycolate phosphatase n=1 Tax=Succiniclasticum ruminis DSM 9236 TaxID=1123323 RepID=A0A1I2B9V1_9FIRM|nr:HAD-IIIA family hydrolase [Succiniclasticum ruminis]SFE52982.1 phosphoglycolate phosphatase [Succiniclasticum ruminis DSM 9236]
MKRYKAIIFDLDGTLLDTLTDLAEGTNYALHVNGFPERTLDEIRRFVGNGARKLIERAVPDGQIEAALEKVRQDFNVYYKIHCKDHTGPYPGIMEMLQELVQQGYSLGVVSNKPDFAVQDLIPEYFPDIFSSISGERQGVAKKPAPDLILEAMKNLQADSSNAVYVGDSEVDMEAAANAGIPCISVVWGFKGKKFLEEQQAEMIIEKPSEIQKYL